MKDEYKGIYFKNRNNNGPHKKFFEHGAHFEYNALCTILEEITKNKKPKFTSSIPKTKNISLNKIRASSCEKKKQLKLKKNNKKENIYIKNNIKINILNYNQTKTTNKKNFNNSLTLKKSSSKNFSFGKNFKKINKFLIDIKKTSIKDKSPKDSRKKTNILKYNSSIINNSMEYFYNNNVNLNESSNSHCNNKNSVLSLYHTKKKKFKFNAFALSDFSKKNENIIFSYNKTKKENNEKAKTNKYKLLSDNYNNNLISKDNKKKSIEEIINNPFDLKDEQKKKDIIIINNKINITEITINGIKSGMKNSNHIKKKKSLDFSVKIKTPKCNYNEKTYKKKFYKNNYKKNSQQIIKTNLNKAVINDFLKMKKRSDNDDQSKNNLSRNNENYKTENSFLNKKSNNFQLTFYNFKNINLIKNYNFNNDSSEIFDEKNKKKNVVHSIDTKDIKKYIKKKILEKNKLNFEIKDKINSKKPESTKNNFNKYFLENKNNIKNNILNYYYNQNYIYTESNKSNNDSINKSKPKKHCNKKKIISNNIICQNNRGLINPLYQKKIEILNL